MWWEPPDRASQETAEVVRRMAGRYFEHVDIAHETGAQLVWGIGSGLDVDGRWRPLVLVDYEAFARAGVFPPLARTTFGNLREAVPDTEVWGLLFGWEIPPDTLVEVVTRPVPGVASGQVVEEAAPARRHAIVGLTCMLKRTGDIDFITAGHLVDGAQARVVVTNNDYYPHPTIAEGTVVAWSDPYKEGPAGGFDYAVVQVDRGGVEPYIPVVPHPTPVQPYVPINALMLRQGWQQAGAQRYGMVTGALNQVGDGDRQWRSCWMLGPSFLLNRGDSGTLLVTMDAAGHGDKILGHFVGGSYWPDREGLVHLYVQDFSESLKAGLEDEIMDWRGSSWQAS
jgi:hypothetical protein